MEIVSSIAGKMAELLFVAAGRELGYLHHYNDNIEALKKQAKKLMGTRDRVQGDIDAAKSNGEIIVADVQNWIEEANAISADAEKFLEEEVKENKRCLKGWCVNLKKRYQFSKEAKQRTLVISQHHEEGKFQNVSRPAPLPGIISPSIGFSRTFESRESIKKEIMKAMNQDNVNIIGVCGMGGVGKTALVKEIIKQAKEDRLYDAVVMVVVSQTPRIMNIQGEIAVMLGLPSLPADSILLRAGFLWERIKEKKRILVILDDVWGRIKLDEIGIPFGKDHGGCTIVLTSRSKNVCNQMDCQKIFVVGTLLKQESWALFKELVSMDVESSDISPIAREVAVQCGGLPIAIVTVARALKNQSKYVWMDAVQQLKKSTPTNIEGMDENVISSLELSFNRLETQAKSLFLFCSLFPEDFNIPIEVLVRYGTGMRWFKDLETIMDIRVRTNAVVSTLVSSFLLIAGDEYHNDCVKVHGVVREFALVIAPKCKQIFMAKAGIGLLEWPSRDTFEHFTCISLMANDIRDLPNGLECPKLQALLLQDNTNLVVHNSFFQGMKDLKVLDLGKAKLSPLPESLSFLTNLRTLNLARCKLGDLSVIGKLSKLEILSLFHSEIEEIPISFSQLSNLRLLDLNDCSMLTLISCGVLSSLQKLEELYIDSFENWDSNSGNLRSNASLVELQASSRLTSSHIIIQNPGLLPNNMPFKKLSHFNLRIGCDEGFDWETSRFLRNISLSDMRISNIYDWVKNLLERTEYLYINKITNLENISYDLIKEGFKELKHLSIISCEIKYLLNTLEWTKDLTFYNLEELEITLNPNLVEICHGQSPTNCFNKLKYLRVYTCNNMLDIVPSHLLQRLQNLKSLDVNNCSSVVYIFNCEGLQIANGETKLLSSLEYLELRDLPEMSHIWKGHHQLISLHNLKMAHIYSCRKLIQLFSPALLQSLNCLEKISISGCYNLKEIFEKKEVEDQEIEAMIQNRLDHTTTFASLANLTSIQINFCYKLKTIFTSSIAKSLVKLGILVVWGCPKIEEIVTNEEGEKGASIERMVFPSLYEIALNDLSNLTCFSSGSYSIEYPALDILSIYGCPKMETFGCGDQITPKLNEVDRGYENRWNGSLNTTIQQLFNEKQNRPRGSAESIDNENEEEEAEAEAELA